MLRGKEVVKDTMRDVAPFLQSTHVYEYMYKHGENRPKENICLLPFYFLVGQVSWFLFFSALCSFWDLSSLTRNQAVPPTEAWSPNHWTSRKFPASSFFNVFKVHSF